MEIDSILPADLLGDETSATLKDAQHFAWRVRFVPVDNEIELLVLKWQVVVVFNFVNFHTERFQAFASDRNVGSVALGGIRERRQGLQTREKFASTCTHV